MPEHLIRFTPVFSKIGFKPLLRYLYKLLCHSVHIYLLLLVLRIGLKAKSLWARRQNLDALTSAPAGRSQDYWLHQSRGQLRPWQVQNTVVEWQNGLSSLQPVVVHGSQKACQIFIRNLELRIWQLHNLLLQHLITLNITNENDRSPRYKHRLVNKHWNR